VIDYVDDFIFDGTALLIAEDGADLLARTTPIAFIATGRHWVNNHAHVVTETDCADLNYLSVFINRLDVSDFITGSVQPKLTQANLNKLQVQVPP
jgi:type I restriction enzyme S subunit